MITETIAFYFATAILGALIGVIVGHFVPAIGLLCAASFAAASIYARHFS